jgi:DNA-binding NarL/FixJ family response regulator
MAAKFKAAFDAPPNDDRNGVPDSSRLETKLSLSRAGPTLPLESSYPHPTRIAVIHADSALRASVDRAFASPPSGPWLIDHHPDLRGALPSLQKQPPAVALLDTTQSASSPDQCVRELLGLLPSLPIILVASRTHALPLLNSIKSGARGCFTKPVDPQALICGVARALRGERFLCAASQHLLVSYLNQETSVGRPSDLLTSREHEIRGLVVEGRTNKEICVRLSISEHTVHVHVAHILHKEGAHSRKQLRQKYLGD